MTAIHPTAIISPRAELGRNVEVGAFSIIEDNVIIGDSTRIGPYCYLGHPSPLARIPELRIGAESLIRSYSVFYAGSTFGDRLTTGHRVTIRENIQAGTNLQIGTLCDLQGLCQIGDYVRFHSNVHVGQLSTIGDFVWIFPYVVLTNDPHPPSSNLLGCVVEDFAAIATMSIVLPGARVGRGALVGAMTVVKGEVPGDTIVVGSPMKLVGSTSSIKLKGGDQLAYPWRRHFHRGYPDDIVAQWRAEFPNG
jgi:acetyltransferase-like isoleucine patch superfamily enzyme